MRDGEIVQVNLSLNSNGRSTLKKSRWVSKTDEGIVFSGNELEQLVEIWNLGEVLDKGHRLSVRLRSTSTSDAYTAHPCDLTTLELQQITEANRKRLTLHVDGPNFLRDCKKLKLDPGAVLEHLVREFSPVRRSFFVCWDAILHRGVLKKGIIELLKTQLALLDFVVISREPRVVTNNSGGVIGRKDDIDLLLAMGMVLDYADRDIDGIILCSGDSDYLPIVKLWLGRDIRSVGVRSVQMVVSHGSVATEYGKSLPIRWMILDHLVTHCSLKT